MPGKSFKQALLTRPGVDLVTELRLSASHRSNRHLECANQGSELHHLPPEGPASSLSMALFSCGHKK